GGIPAVVLLGHRSVEASRADGWTLPGIRGIGWRVLGRWPADWSHSRELRAKCHRPSSWRTVSGYVYHPDFVAPFSDFDVALVFLSQPVNDIEPGRLPPAGYLDSFKNAELQASVFTEVGYGTLGAEDNFALTGDRRVATAAFQQ